MTAALSDAYPPSGGWTTDDLDALPEDGRRRELLDGVLLMSPSPTDIHQVIAARLVVLLEASCPDDLHVTQGVEVRLSSRRAFIPDVLVTTATAAERQAAKYAPHEVMLAIEIVSESSQSMDRVMKPALYAQSGIPFYWRVETKDRLAVHTHRLDPTNDCYLPTGDFSDHVTVSEPWEIDFSIGQITPRFFTR